MDIGGWLQSLGLEQFEAVFRENAIDADVLRDLTKDHLREMGLPLGARLKLLKAISALAPGAEPIGLTPVIAPAGPPADTAERRQVTVMFADLVGSTALSACMDPEDLREVISAYQKCTAEAVRRFGGFVARYMGDGVLVYFGYPEAHEDDAERAVRAGHHGGDRAQDDRFVTNPCQHRHWAGRCGRSIWIGRSTGTRHRRQDTKSCSASAGDCRAKHGGH